MVTVGSKWSLWGVSGHCGGVYICVISVGSKWSLWGVSGHCGE